VNQSARWNSRIIENGFGFMRWRSSSVGRAV
jgi:hypothetical protein